MVWLAKPRPLLNLLERIARYSSLDMKNLWRHVNNRMFPICSVVSVTRNNARRTYGDRLAVRSPQEDITDAFSGHRSGIVALLVWH